CLFVTEPFVDLPPARHAARLLRAHLSLRGGVDVDHLDDDPLRLAQLLTDDALQDGAVGLVQVPDVSHEGIHAESVPRFARTGYGDCCRRCRSSETGGSL